MEKEKQKKESKLSRKNIVQTVVIVLITTFSAGIGGMFFSKFKHEVQIPKRVSKLERQTKMDSVVIYNLKKNQASFEKRLSTYEHNLQMIQAEIKNMNINIEEANKNTDYIIKLMLEERRSQ